MTDFRITAAAKQDLKNIAKFTQTNWGREQRNIYLTDFDHAFHQLAENPELGQECDYVYPGYRFFPVGSHLVFYKSGIDKTVEIIRVLHKRMNVSSRI